MKENLPVRKRNRLENYDYSQDGAYYITLCVKDNHEILSDVAVGAAFCRPIIQLTEIGKIVENEISVLSKIYDVLTVNEYIIMPNHVHMVLSIDRCGRQNAAPTISRALGQWKRVISMKIGYSIWQKSFYDRIIRDSKEYENICRYIEENPQKWKDIYKNI